ncbi:hypothetical protein KIPB_006814, partial [Kipferlia bialata]
WDGCVAISDNQVLVVGYNDTESESDDSTNRNCYIMTYNPEADAVTEGEGEKEEENGKVDEESSGYSEEEAYGDFDFKSHYTKCVTMEEVPCPIPRHIGNMSVDRVGGEVYVFAGHDLEEQTLNSDLWVFCIATRKWRLVEVPEAEYESEGEYESEEEYESEGEEPQETTTKGAAPEEEEESEGYEDEYEEDMPPQPEMPQFDSQDDFMQHLMGLIAAKPDGPTGRTCETTGVVDTPREYRRRKVVAEGDWTRATAQERHHLTVEHPKTMAKMDSLEAPKPSNWPMERREHTSFVLDDALHICCGINEDKSPMGGLATMFSMLDKEEHMPASMREATLFGDLWRYEADAGRWTKLPSPPCRFHNAAALTINGKAHIIGGTTTSRVHLTYTSGKGWVREAPLRFRAVNPALFTVGVYLVVYCGHKHERAVHAYNTLSDKWIRWPSLPPFACHNVANAAQLSEETVIVHGQQNTTVVHVDPAFLEYLEEAETWEEPITDEYEGERDRLSFMYRKGDCYGGEWPDYGLSEADD